MAARIILRIKVAARFYNSMSHYLMHDLDVECGPSSFCIPEFWSNGIALPETCVGICAFHVL